MCLDRKCKPRIFHIRCVPDLRVVTDGIRAKDIETTQSVFFALHQCNLHFRLHRLKPGEPLGRMDEEIPRSIQGHRIRIDRLSIHTCSPTSPDYIPGQRITGHRQFSRRGCDEFVLRAAISSVNSPPCESRICYESDPRRIQSVRDKEDEDVEEEEERTLLWRLNWRDSESEQPLRKRLCLFHIRGIRDVGYGIRDTWVDPAETVPEIAPVTLGEVNTRVNLLMGDRMTLQETVWMVEEEAYASREAWAHSIGLSQAGSSGASNPS
ncbi:hypothetical protein Tco_1069308 [Tanacetum coccineum]|uniref:RNA polymerase alpha subunit n=1 Tax=Tanacetum coccineum TaxID=301880 RepID=A0ABQ5HIC9_9ASTR